MFFFLIVVNCSVNEITSSFSQWPTFKVERKNKKNVCPYISFFRSSQFRLHILNASDRVATVCFRFKTSWNLLLNIVNAERSCKQTIIFWNNKYYFNGHTTAISDVARAPSVDETASNWSQWTCVRRGAGWTVSGSVAENGGNGHYRVKGRWSDGYLTPDKPAAAATGSDRAS